MSTVTLLDVDIIDDIDGTETDDIQVRAADCDFEVLSVYLSEGILYIDVRESD